MQKLNESIIVSQLSEMFALSLGFSYTYAQQIKTAALLHDIGKIGIPSAILNKPDRLTQTEYRIVKFHTKIGAHILADIPGELGIVLRTTCEFHHEWFDGGGYWGIPTDKLPSYIPIISIADVFVACCSKRPYKNPWSFEQTLRHLNSLKGTQFSSEIVDAFVCLIDKVVNLFIILLNEIIKHGFEEFCCLSNSLNIFFGIITRTS